MTKDKDELATARRQKSEGQEQGAKGTSEIKGAKLEKL